MNKAVFDNIPADSLQLACRQGYLENQGFFISALPLKAVYVHTYTGGLKKVRFVGSRWGVSLTSKHHLFQA